MSSEASDLDDDDLLDLRKFHKVWGRLFARDPNAAGDLCRRAMAKSKEVGDVGMEAHFASALSNSYFVLEDDDEGMKWLRFAEELCPEEAYRKVTIARNLLDRYKDPEAAILKLQDAEPLINDLGMRYCWIDVAGPTLLQLGRLGEAEDLAGELVTEEMISHIKQFPTIACVSLRFVDGLIQAGMGLETVKQYLEVCAQVPEKAPDLYQSELDRLGSLLEEVQLRLAAR